MIEECPCYKNNELACMIHGPLSYQREEPVIELHFMDCDGEDPCSCDREAVELAWNAWVEDERCSEGEHSSTCTYDEGYCSCQEDLDRWEGEGGA